MWSAIFNKYFGNELSRQMTKRLVIPDEVVIHKIHLIRNHKVMLDFDLAELYQVETGRLNER